MAYKWVYFSMWCDVLQLMKNGAHLTQAGLLQIVCIKAAFKKGYNFMLTNAFPDTVSIEHLVYYPPLINLYLNWVAPLGPARSAGWFYQC
jgi:hypothetical protein